MSCPTKNMFFLGHIFYSRGIKEQTAGRCLHYVTDIPTKLFSAQLKVGQVDDLRSPNRPTVYVPYRVFV